MDDKINRLNIERGYRPATSAAHLRRGLRAEVSADLVKAASQMAVLEEVSDWQNPGSGADVSHCFPGCSSVKIAMRKPSGQKQRPFT